MRLCPLVFFILALSGCGYVFQGSGSVLPPEVKKIYIPFVDNDSTEAGLAGTMTEALRDQFERFGVVTVVENSSEADATLKARILKISKGTQATSGRNDSALSYDSTLTLAAELRRNNGQVLWRDSSLQVNRAYGATSGTVVSSSADFASGGQSAASLGGLSSREVQRGQEQDALDILAQQAAKKIYNDAVAPDF